MVSSLVRWIVYSAILYVGFIHNLYCIQISPFAAWGWPRIEYFWGDSADLVLNRLADSELHPLTPLITARPNGEAIIYPSQFGLQGIVLSAIGKTTGSGVSPFIASALFAALSAGVIAAFYADIASRVGPVAGNTAVGLSAGTIIFLPIATSMYWAAFTLFLPFLVTWFGYPWAVGKWQRWIFVTFAVGVSICVKCLCGYEYITAVIAAPSAAIAYFTSCESLGFRRWLIDTSLLVLVGLTAFAAALFIHIVQLETVVGVDGVAAIRHRAETRTATSDIAGELWYKFDAPEPTFVPEQYRTPVRGFINYFWQPVVATPGTWGKAARTLSLGAITLIIIGIVLVSLLYLRKSQPQFRAIAIATIVGFLASISWQLLAINHMLLHIHLNQIVFFIPFLLFGYTLIGVAIQLAASRARIASLTDPIMLMIACLIIATNIQATADRAVDAKTADRRAIQLVQNAIKSNVSIPPPTVSFWLDSNSVQSERFYAGRWLIGSRRLTQASYGSADKTCTVVRGWAFDSVRDRSRSSVRLVVCRGSAVIPIEVEYFEQFGINKEAGRRMQDAAFQAILPDATDPLRIFLVSNSDDQPVGEVKLTPPK